MIVNVGMLNIIVNVNGWIYVFSGVLTLPFLFRICLYFRKLAMRVECYHKAVLQTKLCPILHTTSYLPMVFLKRGMVNDRPSCKHPECIFKWISICLPAEYFSCLGNYVIATCSFKNVFKDMVNDSINDHVIRPWVDLRFNEIKIIWCNMSF